MLPVFFFLISIQHNYISNYCSYTFKVAFIHVYLVKFSESNSTYYVIHANTHTHTHTSMLNFKYYDFKFYEMKLSVELKFSLPTKKGFALILYEMCVKYYASQCIKTRKYIYECVVNNKKNDSVCDNANKKIMFLFF